MSLKDYVFYAKVISFFSIIGSIYLVYRTKDYYYIFAVSVMVFVLSMIFQYVYERFLQEYTHLKKKKMTIESLSHIWTDKEEIERLKQELKQTKKQHQKLVEVLMGKVQAHDRVINAIASVLVPDKNLEGKQIVEPINSIDKVVGWNENDRRLAQTLLSGLQVSESSVEDEFSQIDQRLKPIIKEENVKKFYLDVLKDAEKEKVDEFLKYYSFAKENGINFDVNSLIHGVFISENEQLRSIRVEIYKKENNIDLKKFYSYVKVLALSDEPFEYDGKVFKKVVFVDEKCVYVNFAVFRKFFENYSDEKEELFAQIFSNDLCPSIDWKKGYIKRNFKLSYNGNTVSAPFIAIRKSVIDENLQITKGAVVKV